MEYLNPFGSNKDRAIKKFMSSNLIKKYDEVVEASSGSTAISLAQTSHIMNKRVTLFMPDDLSPDKVLGYFN
jgi:cysteine synthase